MWCNLMAHCVLYCPRCWKQGSRNANETHNSNAANELVNNETQMRHTHARTRTRTTRTHAREANAVPFDFGMILAFAHAIPFMSNPSSSRKANAMPT